MKGLFRFALILASMAHIAHACDFKVQSMAVRRFYREAGWILPSFVGASLSAPVNFVGSPPPSGLGPVPVPGVTIRGVFLDKANSDSRVFEIPRQEFESDGKLQVMPSQQMLLDHMAWRYDVKGKIVAYTIGITPARAIRANGKWQIDGELGCTFNVSFIDVNGDGVFRVLASGWLTTDLVPEWVAAKKDSE